MKATNGYGSVYKLKGNRRNPWTAGNKTGMDQQNIKNHRSPQTCGFLVIES